VGQDLQDRAGHSSGQRASVREAAELLGTTVDAIRKRVQRGTIPYEKDFDGRVWIVLDAVQDTTGSRQDTGQPQSDPSALISAKDETIAALRDQLEAERQAHAEARRLLMAALERIPPQLEAPSEASEAAEAAEEQQGRGEPHTDGVESQEGTERTWWRRVLGG
jgi:excisionase family DNA binding protein